MRKDTLLQRKQFGEEILVDKNPRVTASLIFAITLGNAAQVGSTISPTSGLNRLSAGHLSTGRCEKLPRCLCSDHVGPLHTTSFRCAYCTLHFDFCQDFSENSLTASRRTSILKRLKTGRKAHLIIVNIL